MKTCKKCGAPLERTTLHSAVNAAKRFRLKQALKMFRKNTGIFGISRIMAFWKSL